MKKIIVVLAGLAIMLSACFEGAPKAMRKLPEQMVNTKVLTAGDIPLTLVYPAKLSTEYNVVLIPKVSGQIEEKFFKAGQSVKKGDALYLIDPSKYQAAAQMAYGDALLAKANYENVLINYKRDQVLIKKKAISQKEFDDSKNAFDVAVAKRISAKARLASARIDLDHTVVKAPYDGVMSDSIVDVGQYVNASQTELVRIVSAKEIHADFYISDVDKLKMVKNIDSGKWEFKNLKTSIDVHGLKREGKLDFLDSIINAKTPTVKARAIFDNKDSKLIPGTFVNVKFYGFTQKNGFDLKQIYVLQDAIGPFCYVLINGKVAKKRVVIAAQDYDKVVISDGLKTGDVLILNNYKKIRAGLKVKNIGSQNIEEFFKQKKTPRKQ